MIWLPVVKKSSRALRDQIGCPPPLVETCHLGPPDAGAAAQHQLIAHELAVVLAEGAVRSPVAGVGRVGAAGPFPDVAEELAEAGSRRRRGMFDKFVAQDMDRDGDIDFVSTRGNSKPYDGVFWLEQVRTPGPVRAFTPARSRDSPEVSLPAGR